MSSIPKNKKKAGHRSWAPRNLPIRGGNRGDIMSPDKRRALMARIRGKNTKPERIIKNLLRKNGLRLKTHVKDLPGRPDFVSKKFHLAIFIDGNFWHGWRFPLWESKLTPFWKEKIRKNRLRDQRNFRRLKQKGWKVIRIWEHQIERDPEECLNRIAAVLESQKKMFEKTASC